MPQSRLARAAAICLALAAPLAMSGSAAASETETIVLVRHGEKPAQGLGQLDCQGLNRSLALPSVIAKQFGKPAFVFAPDPAVAKSDSGQTYDYVRPLATIEPTAIAFGLPVDASIGFNDVDALRHKLENPALRGAFVLVAWEHVEIVKLARLLMAANGGDPGGIPDWDYSDFDSIYVLKLTRENDRAAIAFEHRKEGLDGLPATCPGPPL